MEALTIITTLLAVIVAVAGIVLTLRGFKPLEVDYSWAFNAAMWVWGRLKLVVR